MWSRSQAASWRSARQKADFFTFRYTGATDCAERATDREELMRVVNLTRDTNVETVRRHYFNFEFEDDEQVVDRWELPQYDPSDSVRRASLRASTLTN